MASKYAAGSFCSTGSHICMERINSCVNILYSRCLVDASCTHFDHIMYLFIQIAELTYNTSLAEFVLQTAVYTAFT